MAPVGTLLGAVGVYVASQIGLEAAATSVNKAKLLLGVMLPVGTGLGLLAASISSVCRGIAGHLHAAGNWQERSQTYTYADSPTLTSAKVTTLEQKRLFWTESRPVRQEVEFRSGARLVSEYDRLGEDFGKTTLARTDGSTTDCGPYSTVTADGSKVALEQGMRSQTFLPEGRIRLTSPDLDGEGILRLNVDPGGRVLDPELFLINPRDVTSPTSVAS